MLIKLHTGFVFVFCIFGLPPFLSPWGILGWDRAGAEVARGTIRVELVATVLASTAIGCLGDIGQELSSPVP